MKAQLQPYNISFDISRFGLLFFQASLPQTTLQETAQSTDWPRQQCPPPCQVPQPHVHSMCLVNTICYLKAILMRSYIFSTMTIVN